MRKRKGSKTEKGREKMIEKVEFQPGETPVSKGDLPFKGRRSPQGESLSSRSNVRNKKEGGTPYLHGGKAGEKDIGKRRILKGDLGPLYGKNEEGEELKESAENGGKKSLDPFR